MKHEADSEGGSLLTSTNPAVAPETALPERDPLPRGSLLGRYVVLYRVGSGAMGVVYAAYDPELDRKIALKLLRPEQEDPEARTRLLREAQAMARLSHPNVIAVHDVGTVGDQVFIAVELVEGETLVEWLQRKPRTWKQILRVFKEAGQGLAAAHRAGLVHRDFKPANVLLGVDGRTRVVDFGLARAAGEAESPGTASPESPPLEEGVSRSPSPLDTPVTQAGWVIGTLPYMAPELPLGQRVDARSDQFSFCVALYEALYGEHPFASRDDSAHQLVDRLVKGEVRPLSSSSGVRSRLRSSARQVVERISGGAVEPPRPGVGIPSWLRSILLRGLKVDAPDRFPSMDALLEALERGPRARARLGIVGGAVAFGVLFGLILLRDSRLEPMRLCEGGEAKIAQVWDPQRKNAIHEAFLASGAPSAAASWARVQPILDAYTRDWVDMHQETCETTYVLGEQSENLLDRRMICLGERLQEIRTLADLFGEADAEIVSKAMPAVQGLPPLSGCADTAALLAPIEPPQGPDAASTIEEIEADLARARTLSEALGRFDEAQTAAQKALDHAERLGFPPLQAQALFRLGAVQRKRGAYDAAANSLVEAMWAAEHGQDDRLSAEAAIEFVWLFGVEQNLFARADYWARLADAKLDRSRGNVEILRTKLYSAQGAMLRRQGRYEEALALHFQALRGLQTASRKGERNLDLEVAQASDTLAMVLGELGRPGEALPYFEKALEIRRERLGSDHPSLGNSHNNLGIALKNLERYDEALEHQTKAREIYERALGPGHSNTYSATNNIASTLERLGRGEEALALLDAPLESLRGQPDHPMLPVLLATRATALQGLGRHEEALRELTRVLDLDERQLGADHPYFADDLVALSRSLLKLGRPAEALPLLERSLAIRESSQEADDAIAEARFELAKALRLAGRDAARARSLAESARGLFAAGGEEVAALLEAVEAWLAEPSPTAAPEPPPAIPERSSSHEGP